jgi:hypothetical protein
MSIYEDGGSIKGSGVDAFEFEYGNFTCKNEECLLDNYDAVAYGNDWGYWEVTCEECDVLHDSGTRNTPEEEEWW